MTDSTRNGFATSRATQYRATQYRATQYRATRYSQSVASLGLLFWVAAVSALFTSTTLTSPVFAQGNMPSGFGDETGLFPNFSLGGFDGATGESAKWNAKYFLNQSDTKGRLDVEVKVARGWHIYSVTQPSGGPLPTEISIESPKSVKLAGAFTPAEPPLKSVSPIFKGVTIEEHDGTVVWSAPIIVPEGFREPISIGVEAQICKTDGSCVPIEETLTATFAGTINAPSAVAQTDPTSASTATTGQAEQPAESSQRTFRDEDYQVQWSAELVPAKVEAGGRAELRFTAKPDSGFHVYRAAVDDADSSTNFVIIDKSKMRLGSPQANSDAHESELLEGIFYHEGDVIWTIPVQVPQDATEGEHKIKGAIAYQACTESSCQQPAALQFVTTLRVNKLGGSPTTASPTKPGPTKPGPTKPGPVTIAAAKRSDVLDLAATTKWVDSDVKPQKTKPADKLSKSTPVDAVAPIVIDSGRGAKRSFSVVLLFAFLGGVILNFMPCVLPVVGLKVMSFVQQAGADRKRAFLLNFFYAAGIMAVFAVLTAMIVMLSFSWGEQFTYFPVRIGLTVLMFAMALSYLGVWEIPVPGMASGKASQDLQQREGLSGAFFKGAFATVLSTPCSGPFLGVILGLTIALSPLETTAILMTIGLGMAFPYVMIGIWPVLVSWLPKPGDWMETLKEFLAFLFLATVAFFFSVFDDADKLPVFVTLIGVWFGCWIIGKVPNWADLGKRVTAWAGGVGIATAIGVMAFSFLGEAPPPADGEKLIAWQEYDEAKLQQYQAEGRTVLVDFTAKWCVNCIVNYNVALNTDATRKMIEELDAVPMLADWTNKNEEIKSKLEELQSRSIPVLAIYPGARPNQPIVLRDLVSQSAVLDALEKAGPSLPSATSTPISTQMASASMH
ncbi:Thiol:disulfide interchange protein DsbD precursor [Planctomycetes bacterium CA13]|uniref:Thiol:disulfide interchange protein DsbD n=1 Tax=Novipirellula herctigrandis TaxID=2527986 RepID=A0A5C5YVB5_9BACT|nr:Thiol:disulfide interchange protein DsbD precursor [Planctomycetes bacterium CA13]